MTILMISQRPSLLRIADRTLELTSGKLLSRGGQRIAGAGRRTEPPEGEAGATGFEGDDA